MPLLFQGESICGLQPGEFLLGRDGSGYLCRTEQEQFRSFLIGFQRRVEKRHIAPLLPCLHFRQSQCRSCLKGRIYGLAYLSIGQTACGVQKIRRLLPGPLWEGE